MATYGCVQVKTGSVVSYLCKMTVGELIDKVDLFKYAHASKKPSASEIAKLKRNIRRVVVEVVPSIVQNPDLFLLQLLWMFVPGSSRFNLTLFPR